MPDVPDFYCSHHSREAGEHLCGTAPNVTTWFLLEYSGRWERDAFRDSDLPAAVKEQLDAHLSAIPLSRIQFIRQQPRLAPEGIAFFVVQSCEAQAALYGFQLASYEDLLALDIPAIAAGDVRFDGHRQAEPLFLVCAHGRRDRCCAQYGIPVYERLVQGAGARVWQTSHLVGHRFAANLVCFPYGIYNGRVDPDSAARIMEAYRAGQLVPETYRGRACYPEAAQVAEYFLRRQTGSTTLDAYRLQDARQDGEAWEVRFAAVSGGAAHVLRLAGSLSDFEVFLSCKDEKPERVRQYRLLSYRAGA